jgi:4,5-DOPA dioxygenase extradiol
MFALQPGAAGAAMSALVPHLGRPRAIVVISPHWETAIPAVGTGIRLETIHDFGGFDPRLYDIQYPATGCPEVAGRVISAIEGAGLPVAADPARGLDHGAWVPLRQMFPGADIPTVPLSIQHHGGPRHAWRVGRAIAPLTGQGILIVASGNITHNLRDWQSAVREGSSQPPAYVREFSDWIEGRLDSGDLESLLDYRSVEPTGSRAHPRDEHLLPLFTAIGAAGPASRPRAFHRGISDHVIAMDGYLFD